MQTIGRYQVVSELGKGAMGRVYQATDPTIGRSVALKTLRLDVHGFEADEIRRRFQNEARAAGVLNHTNIVTIYDAGEDQGLFYIAMEYIPGETLAEILKREGALCAERVVAIATGICAGLDFAHDKGIVHRDIKPANIMIAPDGTAKIMDFGIAKAPGNLTNTGQVVGTPNYMSPEQVRGKPLDGRTDLFSLGVMMYEMLTGRKPFASDDVTSIIYKIVNEDPACACDVEANIHPALSAIVARAMSKDPAARYVSGAELSRDLANYRSPGQDTNAKDQTTSTTAAAPEQTGVATSSSLSIAVAPPSTDAAAAYVASSPSTKMLARLNGRQVKAIAAAVAVVILVAGAFAVGKRYRDRGAAAGIQRVEAAQAAQVLKAPATEPEQGNVTIDSTPQGAQVEIDGKTQEGWVTPLRNQKLDPGKHTVSFSLENYAPEKKNIKVAAGKESRVVANLASLLATVHLSSDPPGADILLDGQFTGKKTPAEITVPAGDQTFTLRKQGFDESGDTVTMVAGQNVNITSKLTPANGFAKLFRGPQAENRGVLVIRSKPRGALVAINGVVLPGVTPLRIPIRPGKYSVQIAAEGYQPVRRDVVVERGKPTGLSEVLPPQ